MAKQIKTKRKSGKVDILKRKDPVVPMGEYLLTVYMQDKIYSNRTNNIALSLLNLKPKKITNKVRIIIEKDGKKAERMLFVFPARRLFNIPLAAEFFAKNIVQRLK